MGVLCPWPAIMCFLQFGIIILCSELSMCIGPVTGAYELPVGRQGVSNSPSLCGTALIYLQFFTKKGLSVSILSHI